MKVNRERSKSDTMASNKTLKYIKRNYSLYLMLVPGLIYILIFKIFPLYGSVIAFKDFDLFAAETPFKAIMASPWVGFEHFSKIFKRQDFLQVLKNTMIISWGKIIFTFPLPIIFAILLNEITSVRFQKVVQTIVYLPHFLSWTIVAGIFVALLGSTGTVNSLITSLGGEKIAFLMDNDWFRPILFISSAWKETGWGSIIYFAAIAGLDQECLEAARVDGANRFQRIWYITLPGLMPTIIMMLIMRVGSIMEAGFSQVFAMYNPMVYETGDIIGTYVYRIGLGKLDFSRGTAVGLFESLIGFVLVVTSNAIARKKLGKSIW